ncbi:LysR substrate-binding domain-containing protein [Sphingomonas sp. PAMC 26605]|uniref:LysR substrate-binding domain-containing protein n=1 Tax=Sphingomonas sp. PAMC 26605 TaxID=1112214 RepID=UPI00026CB19F|nr:LysR substrate-binding domain-containing protein [Sphingomonas sp. PAMC 26605]
MLLELHLVRTFLAVIDAASFTGAAEALGISQPTVSQHIRRLERLTGQQLILRDTHAVTLTPNGAVLEGFARETLALDTQARAYFEGTTEQVRVRLGVSEDLALTRLPALLRRLTHEQPQLQIDLTVGLTSMLYPKLDNGRLDLILAKRRDGDERGVLIKREEMAWIAHRDFVVDRHARIPLVVYPSGSITTALALQALERAGLPWRMACSSETLTGIWSGLQAGLGISAQSPVLLDVPPHELRAIGIEAGLPALGAVDYVLLGRSRQLTGVAALAAKIIGEAAKRFWV